VKLLDTLLLYPAFALLIIGLHQIIVRSVADGFAKGFAQSYWILMLALFLFFSFQWRRTRRESRQQSPSSSQKTTPAPTKRKK